MVERKEAEEEALLAWSASPLAVREQLGKWNKKRTLSGIPEWWNTEAGEGDGGMNNKRFSQAFLLCLWKAVEHAKSVQSCLTLCDPMDCSPPGSSVHVISQARILEWVAISFSRRSFCPRDWICVSCIGRQILYHWATWEELNFITS